MNSVSIQYFTASSSRPMGRRGPRLRFDADVDAAGVVAADVEPAGLFDEVAELGLAVGARVEVGRQDGQPLAHPAERHPAVVAVVQLGDGGADQVPGLARRFQRRAAAGAGAHLPVGRRRLGQQVLGVDEPATGLAEALRGLLFAEAVDVDPLFADPRGQAGEVAVGGDQAEAVEPARMQQVHGVDHQGDVRGVLAGGVGEVLMRHDRVGGQDVGPAFQTRSGEVSVDPPHAGLADLGDLLEQAGGDARRGVVGVDQDGEAGRAGFGHAPG
jgi:hypothetical protein